MCDDTHWKIEVPISGPYRTYSVEVGFSDPDYDLQTGCFLQGDSTNIGSQPAGTPGTYTAANVIATDGYIAFAGDYQDSCSAVSWIKIFVGTVVCTTPTTLGYDLTEVNLDLSVAPFEVNAVCADGYDGTPHAIGCSHSGPYTVTGCSDTDECSGNPCNSIASSCSETSDGSTPAIGTYHCLCLAGAAGGGEQTPCQDCAAGTYTDYSGAHACEQCPAGRFVETAGSNNDADCMHCVRGKYVDVAGSDEASDCIDCAGGKYSASVGSASESNCIDCVAGKYVESTGSSADTDCIDCAGGKY
eukprot:COSAG02_NODE_2935_length_7705_cov_5.442677_8_plen_300_part_01